MADIYEEAAQAIITSDRAAADTTLQSNIDALSTSVNTHVAALDAMDVSITANVDAEVAARVAAVNTVTRKPSEPHRRTRP